MRQPIRSRVRERVCISLLSARTINGNTITRKSLLWIWHKDQCSIHFPARWFRWGQQSDQTISPSRSQCVTMNPIPMNPFSIESTFAFSVGRFFPPRAVIAGPHYLVIVLALLVLVLLVLAVSRLLLAAGPPSIDRHVVYDVDHVCHVHTNISSSRARNLALLITCMAFKRVQLTSNTLTASNSHQH